MEKTKEKESNLEIGIEQYRLAEEMMKKILFLIDDGNINGNPMKDVLELYDQVEELQAKFHRGMLWRRKELTRLRVLRMKNKE